MVMGYVSLMRPKDGKNRCKEKSCSTRQDDVAVSNKGLDRRLSFVRWARNLQ